MVKSWYCIDYCVRECAVYQELSNLSLAFVIFHWFQQTPSTQPGDKPRGELCFPHHQRVFCRQGRLDTPSLSMYEYAYELV